MVLDFEKFSIFGQIQLTFSRPACLVVCLVVAEGDRKGRWGGGGGGGGKEERRQETMPKLNNQKKNCMGQS